MSNQRLAISLVIFLMFPAISAGLQRKPINSFKLPSKGNSRSAFYEETWARREARPSRGSTTAPIFFEAPEYPAGNQVEAIMSGDFNGDGKVDLAVADFCVDPTTLATCMQSGSSVNVFLGNGDGTFQGLVRYASGTGSVALAIADFNHDGKLDIAVANICSDPTCAASSISILLGNGDGTFQRQAEYATGPGPYAVAVGDLNGDGVEDLVTSDHLNTVSVLLGKGDGSFQQNQDISMSCPGADFCAAKAIVIGDFNGDRKPDLVTANYYGGDLSIFLGNGDGTFQAQRDSLAILGNPSTLIAADLNGDGKLDLVTNTISCNVADSVVVVYGNGDGTFNPSVNVYPTGVNCGDTQVLLADFNGDHKPDLVSVNTLGNAVSVYPGIGDGTFPSHGVWGTGINPIAVTVGDFNGDGKNDIVALNAVDSAFSVLLGNGDNTFQSRTDADTFVNPAYVAAADFNRDGRMDLVTVNFTYNNVSVLLANQNGTFQPHVDYNTPTSPIGVIVADFYLDGNPDFAVDSASGFVSVFLGNGRGTFQTRLDSSIPSAGSFATADYNGDGKPDLVVSQCCGTTGGNVAVLLGNGDGTFRHTADYPLQLPSAPIQTADLNGDGIPDVVLSNDPNVTVLLGKGDGTFQQPINSPGGSGLGPSLVVADFNLDQKLDIAATNPGNGSVRVFLGNGDGSFQPPLDYPAGGQPLGVAVGDVDGDGKADLLVANQSVLAVLLGNGDGTFNSPLNYGVGLGPVAVTVADLNADGRPDVAVTNSVSDTVSVLFNIANIPMFSLSALLTGSGGGTITINPGGFVCSNNCARSYATGTNVSLSAQPAAGSTFSGWSGGNCSGTASCKFSLTGDLQVAADFELAPDFALSGSALAPATVSPGQQSTSTINVTAMGGFDGTVTLSCSVLPVKAGGPVCSVSPASLNPGAPATLTVTTTPATSSAVEPSTRFRLALAFWLPAIGIATTSISSRFGQKRKNSTRQLLQRSLLFTALLGTIACGGQGSQDSHGSPGTPTGRYTIVVAGSAGSLQHTLNVSLTVQ